MLKASQRRRERFVRELGLPVERRIVLYSATPDQDFVPESEGGNTCVFYHHPLVERFDDYDAMVASLLEKEIRP